MNLIDAALQTARAKKILPSALSSAEQASAFSEALRARSIFIARGTNATFLNAIKDTVEGMVDGKINLATGRWHLKQALVTLGYSPEAGFPDAPPGAVPPALAGSLQDISSTDRLNLILNTQVGLANNAGRMMRGNLPDRLEAFPCWELTRNQYRKSPRGVTVHSIGWARRWMDAGGPPPIHGRLIALKTSPIWKRLGSRELFEDGLDAPHPPYAFNSGMGWRELSRAECERLGVPLGPQHSTPPVPERDLPKPTLTLPPGMDPRMVQALLNKRRAELTANRITFKADDAAAKAAYLAR